MALFPDHRPPFRVGTVGLAHGRPCVSPGSACGMGNLPAGQGHGQRLGLGRHARRAGGQTSLRLHGTIGRGWPADRARTKAAQFLRLESRSAGVDGRPSRTRSVDLPPCASSTTAHAAGIAMRSSASPLLPSRVPPRRHRGHSASKRASLPLAEAAGVLRDFNRSAMPVNLAEPRQLRRGFPPGMGRFTIRRS